LEVIFTHRFLSLDSILSIDIILSTDTVLAKEGGLVTEPQRPRHRAESSYSRGEETRRRLIEVAIRLFGQHGYEGASTREITRLAGVNTPALQYYFENKEGLYEACAEYLSQQAETHFGPSLDAAEVTLSQSKSTRRELIEAFCGIQDAMVEFLLRGDEAQQRALFIAQQQAGHGASEELLESHERKRLTRIGTALIARLTGVDAHDSLTVLRLLTANGQLMVFHVAPKVALRALGWRELLPEHLELVKQTVRTQTRALIASWGSGDTA
jgi:TetR/AcrR family transcriptional regulator, regulator of cefoperazone and chloramphenicol sensitivity